MAGDLPPPDAPVSLDVARLIVRKAVDLLQVDDELRELGWDYWGLALEHWVEDHEPGDSCPVLDTLRYTLENTKAPGVRGSLVLSALKLALSACVMARANPFYDALPADAHGDVSVLIREALGLMAQARDMDGSCLLVHNETLVNRVIKSSEQSHLRAMMEMAVRPNAG